ncbi:MAG: serine/threonine protein kinase [Bacteroidia bacterium]|nr:serine/threonine protein kinase [Bacteroidia bacterium]MCX7652927.1 serine/threonine protein kinase [Bacteroidia bacterium]MDW8416605.1 serine/threonine-protein kinase [Bacteroidia bacterium]
MSTLIGKKLLNYKVEKLLGQGGMGEVYLGVHTEIGRKVAIKMISPHLARDPRIQERFKREALIMAKLNHPNIVQLYDYWARPDEGLFLIMEYVEGISLDRYIHRVQCGPLPPKQAIDIFLQVLDAFEYAHKNGVIHRDIKPSNILLRTDNVVKVLDFGIARIISTETNDPAESPSLTKTGTTLGTVSYMSPEQLRSKSAGDIDHRSDIYSLGVVLFEMLTGRELYDRSQLSEFEILVKIATEPPPPLSELNPKIAPDFEPILKKALAKNREDRYQSCQEFAAALLPLIPKYDKPDSPPPVRNPALTKTQVSNVPPTPSPKIEPSKKEELKKPSSQAVSGKQRRVIMISGIAALLIIAAVLWWQMNYSAARNKALAIADSFSVALNRHDEKLLASLFADTLSPFYSEEKVPKTQALQKYFASFWKSIQKDSVSWMTPPEYKREGGTTIVEGTLYQHYTPKPQIVTQVEQAPAGRQAWRRAITPRRTITREVPLPPICKIKRLKIFISDEKIRGIQLLDTRDCP